MSLAIEIRKNQLFNNGNATVENFLHTPPNEETFVQSPDKETYQKSKVGDKLNNTGKEASSTNENTGQINIESEQNNIGSEPVDKEKKSPLSNEFKVAAEIYRCEVNGEVVSYTKLVSSLEGKVSKNTITKALDILFDWGIVESEYGATERGRPGKLLKITNESKPIIKNLYTKYWK